MNGDLQHILLEFARFEGRMDGAVQELRRGLADLQLAWTEWKRMDEQWRGEVDARLRNVEREHERAKGVALALGAVGGTVVAILRLVIGRWWP